MPDTFAFLTPSLFLYGWYQWMRGDAAPKTLPQLRQAYVTKVATPKDTVAQLRAAGKTPEEIARTVSQMRREIGIEFKNLTPADKLAEITARNLAKYGDELGPTIDWLRARGKSWEQIIESATRPGGGDLGF